MKRFLIFGLLRPPILGWIIAMQILPIQVDGYLVNAPKALVLTIAFLPLIYLCGLVPGLAMAGIDAWLAKYPWRFPAVCAVACAASGVILAWSSPDFVEQFVRLGFIGAIPTAI